MKAGSCALSIAVLQCAVNMGRHSGKNMTQTRVNIRTAVNSAKIRRERRNGRDVVIVPSATLPDDVVMNGVKYPAEEIAKSYLSLNRTPAPLGHPMIEGMFVSASDPEGLARGWVGAWNENVRRESGRVFLDKVIDVEQASQLNGGKAVLAAIENGEPIHTSTGLYAIMEPVENDATGASKIARDIVFDHDAILLGEEGAATPDQGVGMMVNKAVAPDGAHVAVVNSSYMEEDAERQMDWAIMSMLDAAERRKKAGMVERMKSAIMEALGLSEREPSATEKEADMADDKQLETLSAKVDTLSEGLDERIANAVSEAVKPLLEAQAAQAEALKNQQEAELEGYVAEIVKANLLDEASAKELTLNAAKALAEKAKPGKAAPLGNGANPGTPEDEFSGYDLNSMMEAK